MINSSVRTAVELFHLPSRARQLRSEPLPSDLLTLLQIAAGEQEVLQLASREAEISREVLQNAAPFYIEQVLLTEPKDSYRILGLSTSASSLELKRNFGLLMRFLHPDGRPQEGQTVFAQRVTNAWNDLKTPERRAQYDSKRLEEEKKTEQNTLHRSSRRQHINSRRSPYSSSRYTRRRMTPRKSFIEKVFSFFLS